MENTLLVMPNFLTGVARALDFGGALDATSYIYSPSAEAADSRAVESDWRAVGSDLRSVIASHGKKEPEKVGK